MSVIIGTSLNFKSEVLEAKGKVIVDFWADWCGPCQMLSPVIEEVSTKTSTKLVKVNVDEQSELAQQYTVLSIPTVLIFSDGQLKQTIVGFHQPDDYLHALQSG